MSFVDSIILSAPDGSNPYGFAADFVATIIPRKPDWYFANIIASGIVAAINLISTITCFTMMWKRSQAGSGVGLWFFRLRYGHSSGVPYIMPNALTMFLFWNLIFMLLMHPYIWLNYIAWYSPSLKLTSRMYFWYGFVFIWDAVGMWTSAFGTLYATLLPKLSTITPSDNTALRGFFLHPITLNLFCFLPPFGLAVTQIITSTYSAIAWSNLAHTQFALINILSTLAQQWAESATKTVQSALLGQANDLGTLFLKQKTISQTDFQKNAWTCGAWYMLCIVLFTPTAIWLLWVIRDTMNQRSRRVTPHAPPATGATGASLSAPHPTTVGDAQPRASLPFSRGLPSPAPGTPFKPGPQTPGPGAAWTTNGQAGNTQYDDTIRPLRRALYTASLQFAATFFCLGMAAGSWLWIAADAGRMIVNPTLHALAILLTIWVYVVGGCLVNLFIFIRTRRGTGTPSGNAVPLSTIKTSHGSSAQSQTRSDVERKPMFIVAHTTTHIVVDDTPRRSMESEHGLDMGSGKEYATQGGRDVELDSLSTAHFAGEDGPKANPLEHETDLESVKWER